MNILIIGATSGIGHQLWRYYVSRDNLVAVVGRRKAELDEMTETAPSNTLAYACDIAEIESFNDLFPEILVEIKTLDLVILCAGIGELNPGLDVETELAILKVNVEGWTNCVDRVYNQLAEQRRGHIVTITSVGGMQASPVAPSYSASKAFQINYTKALQRKAKGTGVVVTEIRPGLVDTRMAKGDGLFWVMPLDRVVDLIIHTIERKRPRLIANRRWRFLNFLLKHFG